MKESRKDSPNHLSFYLSISLRLSFSFFHFVK